jgi:hypothetical protein
MRALILGLRPLVFLAALAAAVTAPDLPALVPLHTPGGNTLALATLALLALVLAWGAAALGRRRQALAPAAARLGRRRGLLALGALLWLFARVHPVHLEHITRTELYRVAASLLAPAAGLVLTVVAAARLRGVARRWSPAWVRKPAAAAAAAFLLAAFLSATVLERAPHIPDEVAYLFDARSLAAGRRIAAPPPVPAAFPPPEWIEVTPAGAHGIFPPGWPLLLALGCRAGAAWLVNPLVGAAAVGAVAVLARLAGAGAGTAWLAALSPFVLFLSASFMAHPAALLWTAVGLAAYLGLAAGTAPPRPRALALAVAAALLLLTRPIEAAAVVAAIAADALLARPGRGRGLIALAAGLAAGGALLALDHTRLTGSPLVPPVTRYFDTHVHPGANRLGFGPDIGLAWDGSPPGHSPLEALWNLCLNLEQLDRHLLGWPAGSLLLALVHLLGGRRTRGERLLLLHAAAVLVLYGLYWYHGVAFGPRFLAALVPGLAVFTARGAEEAEEWLRGRGLGEGWVPAAVGFSIAAGLALYVPVKAVAEYRGLRGMDGDLLRQVEALPPPALALIDGPRWPDYAGVYFLNAPDFRGPRVVAWRGSGPDGEKTLLAAYPERSACILRRGSAVRRQGGGP